MYTRVPDDKVEILRPGEAPREEALRRLDALATLMDSAFVIPGTGIRMGLDGLIGLVPVLGDLISTAISSYILVEARRLGASRLTLVRMATNIAVDGVIGAVPLAGDVFDVAFRANRRNIKILREHLARKAR
ncbi:MAG: DUF4112 domain-containing protein [Hyphomicrobiaceae bacterium]|nr:DUF4112 domain-containing protein [Hyphomicrobiaceae bacterium]